MGWAGGGLGCIGRGRTWLKGDGWGMGMVSGVLRGAILLRGWSQAGGSALIRLRSTTAGLCLCWVQSA